MDCGFKARRCGAGARMPTLLLCATWITELESSVTEGGEWLDICTGGAAPRPVSNTSVCGSSIGVSC